MRRRAIVLAGPSAAGKTTVMQKMMDTTDNLFYFSRSATTRKPRGDAFDNEYIYLTEEEFVGRIERGEMLEHTYHSGNYYGTPLSEMEYAFANGKIPLLILDMNGIESLKSHGNDFETLGVYVYEDLDVLERRLFDRELSRGENEAGRSRYEKRIAQNRDDYLSLPARQTIFDFIIKNDTVEGTAAAILDFLFGKVTMDKDEIRALTEKIKESADL
jgi:guanylate kinase